MNLERLDFLATADTGYWNMFPEAADCVYFGQSCYKARQGFAYTTQDVTTNTPTTTYCRAPASVQGVAATEYALEHLAMTLGLDPLELRMANLVSDGDATNENVVIGPVPILDMVQTLKARCDYDQRVLDIQTFNQVRTEKNRHQGWQCI